MTSAKKEEVEKLREGLSMKMLTEAKKIDPSIAEWIDESLKEQSAVWTLETLQAAVAKNRRKRLLSGSEA